jgi:hypothetical protein
MDSMVTGTLACHATTLADIDEQVGFTPSRVEVWNPATNVKLTWTKDMAHGTARKDCFLNGCLTSARAAIGSTPANMYTGAIDFRIAGVWYTKAAVAAGTAPTATTIPALHWGCFGFQVGVDGTFHALDAAANAAGYHSEALALAAFEAVAVTAAHVRVACFTVYAPAATFVGATDSLILAGSTVHYYNYQITMPFTLGITPLNDNETGQGFTVGLDTDLQVLGDTLYYTAWRD